MRFTKQLCFIPIISLVSGALAASTPLLDSTLKTQVVYSGVAITMGASSIVGGKATAGSAITFGAKVIVRGNATAETAVTLGADAIVSGHTTAGTAITLGADATVSGHAMAGTDITFGANASTGNLLSEGNITPFDTVTKADFDNQLAQLRRAQTALRRMPITKSLAPTMIADTTLPPGVYQAATLATTAGITLTLDGNNETNFWVFNIDTLITFGANTTIKLLNVTPDSTIIWNTSGYTFVGAESTVIGTIIAGTYITTGAGATLTGIDNACGNIFSIAGAITLGATNNMGAQGCMAGAVNNFIIGEDGIASFFLGETGANAGFDQSASEGETVTLIGSGSGSGTYVWKQIGLTENETDLSLDYSDPMNPTFIVPTVNVGGKTPTFELTFTDDNDRITTDIVNITVKNGVNQPIANAGETQSITAGSPVTLDGAGSYDPDGESLQYRWWQREGDPQVELAYADSAYPTFTHNSPGEFVFYLRVYDGVLGSPRSAVTINITAGNNAPIANAGVDQTVSKNDVGELDARGSSDADGDSLTYAWRQIDGSKVSISNPYTSTPSFNPFNVDGEELVFEVTVSDSNGGTLNDQVKIQVQSTFSSPNLSNAQATPSCLWPPNHKLVPIELTGISGADETTTITINSVTQNEPTNSQGPGDTGNDAIIKNGKLYLRAERFRNGRVYGINFNASNDYGSNEGTIYVRVPHDKKDKSCNSSNDNDDHYYSSLQPASLDAF
jgi:hypothetical protein